MKKTYQLDKESIAALAQDPLTVSKWVHGLRSGEYDQGEGYLFCPKTQTYCCLGVLENVQGVDAVLLAERPVPSSLLMSITLTKFGNMLPETFKTTCGCGLTMLNDEVGLTFNQIADLIEFGSVIVEIEE